MAVNNRVIGILTFEKSLVCFCRWLFIFVKKRVFIYLIVLFAVNMFLFGLKLGRLSLYIVLFSAVMKFDVGVFF